MTAPKAVCRAESTSGVPASAASLILAAPTPAVVTALGDVSAPLTPSELRRAEGFLLAQDRVDFCAAHALVRVCAARLCGVPPSRLTIVQICEDCGGPHGRPVLAEDVGLQVSLSHTRGYVAAIAGVGSVGVDVERYDNARIDAREMHVALSPNEVAAVNAAATPQRAFLRQWVRKEALVKVGRARLEALTELDLSALPAEPQIELMVTTHWETWHVLDWWDPQGAFLGSAVSEEPARVQTLGHEMYLAPGRSPSIAHMAAALSELERP